MCIRDRGTSYLILYACAFHCGQGCYVLRSRVKDTNQVWANRQDWYLMVKNLDSSHSYIHSAYESDLSPHPAGGKGHTKILASRRRRGAHLRIVHNQLECFRRFLFCLNLEFTCSSYFSITNIHNSCMFVCTCVCSCYCDSDSVHAWTTVSLAN